MTYNVLRGTCHVQPLHYYYYYYYYYYDDLLKNCLQTL